MAKLKQLLLIFLLIFSKLNSIAQEDDLIRDIIESFAENLPEEYDLSELTEQLTYFKKHPIDLNNTTPQILKQLAFLSPLQISNLFTHLNSNHQLIDILELQGIDGFDIQTINRLTPFVRIGIKSGLSEKSIKNLFTGSRNDLILRYGRLLNEQKGFKDLPGSRYLGSPDKFLIRYKYAYLNTLTASLVAEKDAGEYLWHGKTGIDHLSANIALSNPRKRIKKIVLGDYSLQYGQGLTLWSGFAFGKGPDVTSVASKDIGLRPYSSSNEASFFRGVASEFSLLKNVNFTSFISYKKTDASLKSLTDGTSTVQNINISGLHRTKTELVNQHSLGQLVYGGVIQYLSNNLNIGLIACQSEYEHKFVTGNQKYNQYAFTGQKLTNTGFHYNYTFNNIYFYGEVAHSLNSGWAIVNGAMASISSKISLVLLNRSYDKDYHNFFSNGVGEGSEINNEQGWYAGLNYSPNKKWVFSAYSDYFKFPWLRYRIDSASKGYEVLGQALYQPNKIFKLIVRYKREQKQQNPDAETNAAGLQNVLKENYRIECNWKLSRKFNFQQRAEVSHYQKGINSGECGYLIYNDLNYHPLSSKVAGNLRIAYFNTPTYDSRIYAYEDDVLYSSSFGVYNGKGIRTFLNLKYKTTRQIDTWIRYGLYLYQDKNVIGSGLDEINGNKKSDIKVQVRYQF